MSNALLLEAIAQLHVAADTKISVILPLNRAHVGIIPLIEELPILIAAAISGGSLLHHP